MSLESYRARVLSQGKNIAESTAYDTKRIQIDYILNSPSRSDVLVNMDEVNSHPCIVSDIDTFKIRRFLFLPDMKVYTGDYICHDNFTYLAVDQTTDDKFPQLIARQCNFDFPIKIEEIKTIIDHEPNGRPIYETTTVSMVKPSVFTSKNYSVADKSSLPLPEGTVNILLPYVEGETLPEINQRIKVRNSDYMITGIGEQNVTLFDRTFEKGYVEVRMQEVVIDK